MCYPSICALPATIFQWAGPCRIHWTQCEGAIVSSSIAVAAHVFLEYCSACSSASMRAASRETISTTCDPSPIPAAHICDLADVLGAWGSDVGGEADSEDSGCSDSGSGSASGEGIAGAMRDGLSLQERYPVQSAQDVRGTWTPLQASGQHLPLVPGASPVAMRNWLLTGLAGYHSVHCAC